MDSVQGTLSSTGLRFGIVAARFNEMIVDRLVDGAVDAIRRTGGNDKDIRLYRCPGAFEIPQVARRVIQDGNIDVLIAVGAVVRGDTPHFDYISNSVTSGLSSIAAEARVALSFGVLTTDNVDQAMARAGGKAGNKGFETAMAAIETAQLFLAIQKQ